MTDSASRKCLRCKSGKVVPVVVEGSHVSFVSKNGVRWFKFRCDECGSVHNHRPRHGMNYVSGVDFGKGQDSAVETIIEVNRKP